MPQTQKKLPQNLVCFLCGKRFRTEKARMQHIFDIHKDYVQKKGIITSTEYSKTLQNIQKQIQCPFCKTSFDTIEGLDRHQHSHHHPVSPFRCEMCFVPFLTLEEMADHKKIMGHRHATCQFCEKSFTKLSSLLNHMDLQHNPKLLERSVHKCRSCNREFRTFRGLYQHAQERHHKVVPCPYCSKFFGDHVALTQHLKVKHPENQTSEVETYDATNLLLKHKIQAQKTQVYVGAICDLHEFVWFIDKSGREYERCKNCGKTRLRIERESSKRG